MGLDVYLYKFDDFETSKRIQKEDEEGSEKIWAEIQQGKKYEELTEEQKNEARTRTDQLRRELNVKEHEGEKIEFNSFKYPLHYFKVGYFRSSYNGSGFNHVVGDAIGIDLYSILNPDDEYEFKPEWIAAKEKTKEAIDKFTEYLKSGCYRVFAVINGKDRIFLIYEDKQMSWYLEALEIVLETIEHVLSQSDPDNYVLHWSS